MSGPELVLYVDDGLISPWVIHALVALEEKELSYQVERRALPLSEADKATLLEHALIAKVPILVHDELWFSESLAISEYLAEVFFFPNHPRLFPRDLRQRARARQIMVWLRTDLHTLRHERPTSSVFGEAKIAPLSRAAETEAQQLLAVAERVISPATLSIGDQWTIADCDLALALSRLIRNHYPVSDLVRSYVEATWGRPSLQSVLARQPR